MTQMDPLAVHTREAVLTGSVTSKDGTTIGYRQVGRGGPGVILLHGSMENSLSHLQLAQALADAYTVYLPDRRGRGLSGPYGKDDTIVEDIEDIDALLTHTGARYVFGVSSGGIIMLQAALTLPAITDAAIYEPPLTLTRVEAIAILTRYDQEMAAGNIAGALVTGMLGAQLGPPIFKRLPRWLLESLTRMMMANEEKKAKPGDTTFRMLAPTLHYDFQLVVDFSERLDVFKAIPSNVLLMGGSQSPAFLKSSIDALEKIIPHAKRVEFPGLNHSGTGNTQLGGRPDLVGKELSAFFR